MEESIVNSDKPMSRPIREQKRIPHFGPLKGAARMKKGNHLHNLRSATSL